MIQKQVAVSDFLTEPQVVQALAIWKSASFPARLIAERVVRPNLAEINRKLGGKSSAIHLAYVVEHVFDAIYPDYKR